MACMRDCKKGIKISYTSLPFGWGSPYLLPLSPDDHRPAVPPPPPPIHTEVGGGKAEHFVCEIRSGHSHANGWVELLSSEGGGGPELVCLHFIVPLHSYTNYISIGGRPTR